MVDKNDVNTCSILDVKIILSLMIFIIFMVKSRKIKAYYWIIQSQPHSCCTVCNSAVRACVEQYFRAIVSNRGTSSDTVCINFVSPGPIQELRLN